MQLIMPSPFPIYKRAEKTYTRSVSAKPNEVTYRGFAMENHISKKNVQSFLSRRWECFVKRLRVIRDLRYFQPSTKRPKPCDIANSGKVSIAAYQTLCQKKAQHASDITKQFVKDFESRYPDICLQPFEKDHLAEIITTSSQRTMLNLASQNVSQTHPADDRGDHPAFSAEFLTAMQSLESEIAAAVMPRDPIETRQPFNPEVTKPELLSIQTRRWVRRLHDKKSEAPPLTEFTLARLKQRPVDAARWSVNAKPQLSDFEISALPEGKRLALKPAPHDVFQKARMDTFHLLKRELEKERKALAKNPAEFSSAIKASDNVFEARYSSDFRFHLARLSSDPSKQTLADRWNAHELAMGSAIGTAVETAFENAIPPANAPKYRALLDNMRHQIGTAMRRDPNLLMPAIFPNADMLARKG